MRSLDRSEADWRLLLLHLTLGGFVVLLIGALATGATHYLERYMHPFFLLTPLWPAWARWTRGQRGHPTGRHYRPRGAAHCTPWARNATNAASLFHMRAWLRRWLRAASSRARSSPRAAPGARGRRDRLPKGADAEFTRIAGTVTPAPERVSVPWQPYPATSAERHFEWTIVAEPRARD